MPAWARGRDDRRTIRNASEATSYDLIVTNPLRKCPLDCVAFRSAVDAGSSPVRKLFCPDSRD
jgi:hypothetical protein